MRRRRTVEQWRRDVFRADTNVLPPAVKVLLLYLADHMRQDDHKVSVPRDKIAKGLGVHRARVAERLAKALEANYLDRVAAGCTGRTAIYQAKWPESVQQSGKQSAPFVGRAGTARTDALSTRRAIPTYRWAERESAEVDTALLDANTRADLSVSPTDRHVGNDENPENRPAAYGLTVCDCHGFTDCASLNRSHTREESA